MGKSGLKVSEIALGSWMTYGDSLKTKESAICISQAIEESINFFDTADSYANGEAERVLGECLKEYDRKDLVVSTKVFWETGDGPNDSGLGRKHVTESIDRSLERLGMNYVDIYYCHHFDRFTPLQEIILTMTNLIDEGKILYWGTSVWTAHQIERVCGIAKNLGAIPPIVEQPRYNMIDRYIEQNVLDAINYNNMGLVTWSSLMYGVLTGKYNQNIPDKSRFANLKRSYETLKDQFPLEKVKQLTEIALSNDVTMAQLALAWILRLDEVSAVLTGASNPEQIKTNVGAVNVTLTNDTLTQIEKILQNKPETAFPYNTNAQMT